MNDKGIFGDVNVLEYVPEMLTGEVLKTKMECLPKYHDSIRKRSEAERLIALNDIYKVYVPNDMSSEIYSKLYLAMIRSLQKKSTKSVIRQQYVNMASVAMNGNGVLGGCDSFSIIGKSGIGKSSSINRAVRLLSEKGIIEIEEPYLKVIPVLLIQCPFDCSAKSLLLEILRAIDDILHTNYFDKAIRTKYTVDLLINCISVVLINHVAVLIIDEIQNVIKHRAGNQLVAMLTQIINMSGISICFVGTEEVQDFFSSVDYLSRRMIGLKYSAMEYNDQFKNFCEVLFKYQYVKKQAELTDDVLRWLYEHSSGTFSLVVALFHDAQEIAILNGTEKIDISVLKEAYEQRMSMMRNYVNATVSKARGRKKKVEEITKGLPKVSEENNSNETVSLTELLKISKNRNVDMVELLKKYVRVEEVRV